jgi:pimeloyl-ACP methyl ester carboxylesterase
MTLLETAMRGQIILSHGSDSGPDATKVSALAAIAESLGWSTQRPDHREEDQHGYAGSVAPRVARLRAAIDALDAPPVLVGSSMGAFAAGLASLERPVAGLFLLATPAAIPGYAAAFDLRQDVPTLLVHGWHDDLCPLDDIYDFARRRSLPLLVLDDDHRLSASVHAIGAQFRLFLDTLATGQ